MFCKATLAGLVIQTFLSAQQHLIPFYKDNNMDNNPQRALLQQNKSGSHTHPAFMPKGMPDAAVSTVLPADSS
jgi:hypothetical protein